MGRVLRARVEKGEGMSACTCVCVCVNEGERRSDNHEARSHMHVRSEGRVQWELGALPYTLDWIETEARVSPTYVD